MWNFTWRSLHITDITNASRTMLFDIHERRWDDELLDAFDIPRNMLPEVRRSSEVYGTTQGSVFAADVPLASIAGDQHAALLSIAYQSLDVLQAMEADSGTPISQLRVDGGACANDLLMQFQANVLGVDVVCPRVIETTALGAAYLEKLAVGYGKDVDELKAQWQLERRFAPQMPASEVASCLEGWKRAVNTAKAWAYV
ncbi:Glycerol kinase [Candidatus Burkholderia pumila]|uniref:Glycerol kinase n=1 Tax=Candidatus Burkholderia pumila TaxID=1090375 RepID=A0ABR5HPH4_9BURK|nr:Glycerol kinase [Candidatus Burkholderia pumila]